VATSDEVAGTLSDAIVGLAKQSAETRGGASSALQLAQAAQALAAAHAALGLAPRRE
jgi:hypothetical protein